MINKNNMYQIDYILFLSLNWYYRETIKGQDVPVSPPNKAV